MTRSIFFATLFDAVCLNLGARKEAAVALEKSTRPEDLTEHRQFVDSTAEACEEAMEEVLPPEAADKSGQGPKQPGPKSGPDQNPSDGGQ